MIEISTAELSIGDVGNRIVMIDTTGNAYKGILTGIRAVDWKYGERPEDKVRIWLKASSDEDSELELSNLPLDFRVQIERTQSEKIVKAKDLLP